MRSRCLVIRLRQLNCVSRFDADTKQAFIDLYSKVDPTLNFDEQDEILDNEKEEAEFEE